MDMIAETDASSVSAGELEPDLIEKMVDLSAKSKARAYCPYSNFQVGCSLLCEDGTIYSGCNVENKSLQLVICAERTAIVKAISEGKSKFRAIFVASNLKDCIVPCGACRQFLSEYGTDWDVYMTRMDGTYMKQTVAELLPHAPKDYGYPITKSKMAAAGNTDRKSRQRTVSAPTSMTSVDEFLRG